MWRRPTWFSLKGKMGIRGQRRDAVLPHPALSTNRSTNRSVQHGRGRPDLLQVCAADPDWIDVPSRKADGSAGGMTRGKAFKGRQFTAEVILWAVRWYLMFPISYRDLELMVQDRGVAVDHTTLT